MKNSEILADTDRLAVLRDLEILDTPAELDYDDVARLASACCRSPIAAVNFVDAERHWTKAIVGVEDGQGVNVSSHLSFCAATIVSPGGVLSFSEKSFSGSWGSHPFVTGPPFLRYYSGAAIVVSGQPIGVVCVYGTESRDLGEGEEEALVALARQASAHLHLRQLNSELQTLAVTDPLTGLANRALLFDRLDMAIAQRQRSGGDVGVLFCDVDDFKQVNDRWGHEVGDRLLREIAARLRASTRDVDTVARFAGDEFVVVCPGLGSPADLQIVVERIQKALREPHPLDGVPISPRLSVGAVLLAPDDTGADVMRRADEAMYAKKAITAASVLRP